MRARITASMVSQASGANFIGGTTKQTEAEANGRARQRSAPPAIRCSISIPSATTPGSEKDSPTCLVVPEQQA